MLPAAHDDGPTWGGTGHLENTTSTSAKSTDFAACRRLEKIRVTLARRGILLTQLHDGSLLIACSDRLPTVRDLDLATSVARRIGGAT